MARLRWVKTFDQVKSDAERNPEFLSSTVRSLRVVYETSPALAAAVIPKPLAAASAPEVCATFSHVAMHITPEYTLEIGSAVFGVRAVYDGVPGLWLLTMPMTSEPAVIGGRETYGEPKKIAQIAFQRDDRTVSAAVTRMGIAYLEARGTLHEALGPRELVEHAYCVKALPACEKSKGLDGEPLLVRLEWKHQHRQVHRVEGELLLRESPFDPVADLPVRRILRMEYEEGSTQSNGTLLRPIPAEWLLPFLHQRYDDPQNQGVEIAGA